MHQLAKRRAGIQTDLEVEADVKRIEFLQFLEAQNLNGLRIEHIRRACAVLTEMGVKGVPSVAQAVKFINQTVWRTA